MAIRPNAIDWNMVFANIDFMSNPTLYCVEMAVFVIFVACAVLARRADKRDLQKVLLHLTTPYYTPLHPTTPHYTSLHLTTT